MTIHTIPVYDGMTVDQSWGLVSHSGANPVPAYVAENVVGWANVAVTEGGSAFVLDDPSGAIIIGGSRARAVGADA